MNIQKRIERDALSLQEYLRNTMMLSKSLISSLKYNGTVLINGQPAKMKMAVKQGDLLDIKIDDPESWNGWPVMSYVQVLYEDEYLVAVFKPAGLAMHPGRGHYFDNLISAVCAYNRNRPVYSFGRLDRDTSGAVIFAKSPFILAMMEEAARKKRWKKKYLALVEGKLEGSGTICLPLSKDPNQLNACRVDPYGLKSITHYRSILAGIHHSLIALELETGRTHQIRVHMKEINHPLLDDPKYSTKPGPRAMLHVSLIEGIHPISLKPLRIVCKMPVDMAVKLKEIEKGA